MHAKGRKSVVEIGLCFETFQRILLFLLLHLKICSHFSLFKKFNASCFGLGFACLLSFVSLSFFLVLIRI